MGALGEELPQPRRRLRDRIGPRDSDQVEAELARGVRQRRLQRPRVVRRRIGQKSRSA
jgi:hypothetical protein